MSLKPRDQYFRASCQLPRALGATCAGITGYGWRNCPCVHRLIEIPSHLSLLPPIHHVHLRQSLAIFLRCRPAQVLLDLVRSHETEGRVRYEAAADEQTRARREVVVGLPERHGLGLAW